MAINSMRQLMPLSGRLWFQRFRFVFLVASLLACSCCKQSPAATIRYEGTKAGFAARFDPAGTWAWFTPSKGDDLEFDVFPNAKAGACQSRSVTSVCVDGWKLPLISTSSNDWPLEMQARILVVEQKIGKYDCATFNVLLKIKGKPQLLNSPMIFCNDIGIVAFSEFESTEGRVPESSPTTVEPEIYLLNGERGLFYDCQLKMSQATKQVIGIECPPRLGLFGPMKQGAFAPVTIVEAAVPLLSDAPVYSTMSEDFTPEPMPSGEADFEPANLVPQSGLVTLPFRCGEL
jgi:hypothetical protein